MPNQGAGDVNIYDDIYVAAMGAGYGTQFEGVGSALMVINLEDINDPGKVEKVLPIVVLPAAGSSTATNTSDIVNSTPGTPVVITPDTARGVTFRGALVYLNDFEGKITKFNLTNMENDGAGKNIKLYDSTILLNIKADKSLYKHEFKIYSPKKKQFIN